MDPRLRAAIIAAINTYIVEQEPLSPETALGSRWVRQGRTAAFKAVQAAFHRPGKWR